MVVTVENGWNALVWREIKAIIAALRLQRSAPRVRLAAYYDDNPAATIADFLWVALTATRQYFETA